MKVSIVLPTHRTSNAALARVLECSTLDPDRFEVIVRDNSENESKRAMLRSIMTPSMKLVTAPACGAFENGIEALRAASGEFVFFMADDDWISVRGLQRVHALAQKAAADPSVSCVTGMYFLETTDNAGLLRYPDLDAPDASVRLKAYLDANAPNVLFYSAVRADVARRCFDFFERVPFKFSYHDQLMSMLYLALGRTLQVDGVVYFYDLGEWETAEKTFAKDRAMYVAAGLPPATDQLHYLLCAMEGGLLLNSRVMAGQSFDRGRMIQLWFGNMFDRFRKFPRPPLDSDGPYAAAVVRLREKWIAQQDVDLNELLLDVSDALEKHDTGIARGYFEFWSTL